jgi:hypothetical protein
VNNNVKLKEENMDWIPALSTTALFAAALWLSRNWISVRLTNAIRHEYEEKIESLRSALRQSEEQFKADLKSKETQIDALRSGALSGIVNRQVVLYQRQILAVEQLWNSIVSLAPARAVSSWISVIKFETTAAEAAKNPRLREMFKSMDGGIDAKDLGVLEAAKCRPFVSPLAWAYYTAYQSIVTHSVLKMKVLQLGLEKDFADVDHITKLVKVALPHHADYIEKYGPSAFHYLLDELELSLLAELGNILSGQKADKEHMEKAAQILQESERLMQENESMKSKQ